MNMKEITELEREIGGIRTTQKYQEMLRVAEEMVSSGNYDHNKMVKICEYSAPYLIEVADFDSMTDEGLQSYINCYLANELGRPYGILTVKGGREKILRRFETFEEAFDFSESAWDMNFDDAYYDSLRIVGIDDTYDVYCIFENSNEYPESIVTVMQIEKKIYGYSRKKWYLRLMDILAMRDASFADEVFELFSDETTEFLTQRIEENLDKDLPR